MNGDALINEIENRSVTVAVLGLGYVGLPLGVEFAKAGIRVLGFEKSPSKIEDVNKAKNYIQDIDDQEFSEVVASGLLAATGDFSRLKECRAIIICVPTPLDKFKKPDMSYIEAACVEIGKNLLKGTFISLESTTYPTTTEHFMKPIIERESGMVEGKDFWLCFSPERIDPGNKEYKTGNTPKIIGGLGEEANRIALALYSKAVQKLHTVSTPRAAEMVKILENTYRLVNISLINELTLLSEQMGIDIWEVIEAAKTKPYGFQAFYPGPGIGGHCIPLDPFYLEYVAKNYDFDLTMIETAGRIDTMMPYRMQVKITYALNLHKKALRDSKILFVGIAYKPDIADDRESPALKLIDEVAKKGAIISYHDPFIPETTTPKGRQFKSIDLTDDVIANADCVVIATNHKGIDYARIVDKAQIIVDLRNAIKTRHKKVVRL